MFAPQSQNRQIIQSASYSNESKSFQIRSTTSLDDIHDDLVQAGFDDKHLAPIAFPGTNIMCKVRMLQKKNDLDIAMLFPQSASLDKCVISIFDSKAGCQREVLIRFDHEGMIDGESHLGTCYFPAGESKSPWDSCRSLRIFDFQIRFFKSHTQVFVNKTIAISTLR
jgi:hypothetical protein